MERAFSLSDSGMPGPAKDFMKFSEMKDMTLVELAAKSRDLRHEMFNLRLQQASAYKVIE